MALEKFDVLALGRGHLTDNSNAAIVFSANNFVNTWVNSTTYAQYNVVEYSGRMYRSKIAGNIGNQPDISPNQFEVLYINPKDGDVCIVVSGTSSTMLQRSGSSWGIVSDQPAIISLTDGQISATPAFVFLGSTKTFSILKYTIKRGSGQGRKRRGEMNILNDGSSTVEYDHEFNEIGSDINVPVYLDMSGSNVRFMYTSAAEGVSVELKYTLTGW
jgi:hypothetical protein